MSTNFDNKPRLAHVLFMDVVAYSQLPTDRQVEVRNQLREIVRSIPELAEALRNAEVIFRDTGDGMALAFFGDLTAPVTCARQLLLALQAKPSFQLRIGLHTGPVYVDTDINSSPNLAGDGINIAQRVMDCGDGGHILVSEATARNLAQFSSLQSALHDLGEIEVKHGVRVRVFNVFMEGQFGNSELPSRIALQREQGIATPLILRKTTQVPAASRLFANRWLAGALLLLLAVPAAGWWFRDRWLRPKLPAARQLVVLPFDSLNHDPLDQAFCDGVVELLTSSLTQVERLHTALWVIPSADVRRLQLHDVGEARKAFQVNLAVTGTLQTEGSQILVIVNLSDAITLRQLASRIIPVSAANRSQLMPLVIAALLDMLDYDASDTGDAASRNTQSKVPSAYDAYLQGDGFLQHAEVPANVDRAIEVLERSVALDPNFAMSQATLADAYLRRYSRTKDKEWLAKADEMAHQSLNLDGNQAFVHIILGRIGRATGEFEQAITEIQRGISIDPMNVAAYTSLALVFADAGRPADAENAYLEAVRIRPGYWPAYSILGSFYELRGEYSKALGPLLMVVKLAPEYAEGHNTLGSLYYYLNRFDDALSEFNKALSLRPTALTYSNRGDMFRFRGDYPSAQKDYLRALKIDPNNAMIWGSLAVTQSHVSGEAIQARGSFNHAIALSRDQLAVNPNNADLRSQIAYFLAKTSNCDEARENIEEARKLASDRVDVAFQSAKVAEICHDRESALSYVRATIQKGYPLREIEVDPDFDQLRQSAAYAEIRSKYVKN